ncbi:transposase [Halodesulfovibrio marinisediminis]|uniref:transposase n=1 Tax=Halodesulfovibrio marinisediminis TaxID=458711 RepID=UPI0038991815
MLRLRLLQGIKVNDSCRAHGIPDATNYNWKSKYVRQQFQATGRICYEVWCVTL